MKRPFLPLFVVSMCLLSLPAPAQIQAGNAPLQPGAEAPGFSFFRTSGLSRSLEEFRGEIVVILFWNTWSTHGRNSLEVAGELHEKLAARGVNVVGITNESPEVVVGFLKERDGAEFPLGISYDAAGFYKVDAFPHVVIVDPEGKIFWMGHPGGAGPEIEKLLEKHPDLEPRKTKARLTTALKTAMADDEKKIYSAYLVLEDLARTHAHVEGIGEDAARACKALEADHADLIEKYRKSHQAFLEEIGKEKGALQDEVAAVRKANLEGGITLPRGDGMKLLERLAAVIERDRFGMVPEARQLKAEIETSFSGTGFMGVAPDPDATEGCVLGQVIEKSAALKVGIEVGDRILVIDGVEVNDFETLATEVKKKKPGMTVTVVLQRGDETLTKEIVLGRRME